MDPEELKLTNQTKESFNRKSKSNVGRKEPEEKEKEKQRTFQKGRKLTIKT